MKPSISRAIIFAFALSLWFPLPAFGYACLWHAITPEACVPQTRIRVAVLDFGESPTGVRAAEKIREALAKDKLAVESGLEVIDRNLALAAALGNGYEGSLNLTTQDSRDLGAAIGCDYFIIGNAETVKRSPSTGDDYFESYAATFIVSARTGQLVSWQRPSERRSTPEEAEQVLLKTVFSDEGSRYRVPILRANEDEAAARTAAVESPPAAIEVMSDDDDGKSDTRAPRPYRRVKPAYPEAAAQAEIEAVVDVLVDIDARGEITKIEIARWAGYGLDQTVIDTVKQMHFFPAKRDGVSIPMRVLLRYNFQRKTPAKPEPKPLKLTTPKNPASL